MVVIFFRASFLELGTVFQLYGRDGSMSTFTQAHHTPQRILQKRKYGLFVNGFRAGSSHGPLLQGFLLFGHSL